MSHAPKPSEARRPVATPVVCPHLAAQPGVRHGFFTRNGGVSTGIYHSLNCGFGSGDDIEHVTENRHIVASYFGKRGESLCTAYQVHSPRAVVLEKPWTWQDAPEADAMVTNTPGIILGILTADCLPILFADSRHRVVAAAHAGWKGAMAGVIEATLKTMTDLGAQPESITATIGPGIAQGSYEVGPEFHARFLKQEPENQIYFIHGNRPGHYLFDLTAYAKDRLRNAGVSHINLLAQDTCLQENDFFSYRRTTLRKELAYGRQVSTIALE